MFSDSARTLAQLIFLFQAFQSQLNQSAAQKQKLILESEGLLEAAKNEGEAIARQVDILARSLGSPGSEVTNEDKNTALSALLELRRIEQLKAIAAGAGNATYFFGDGKRLGRDAYDVDLTEKWKRSQLLDPGAPRRSDTQLQSQSSTGRANMPSTSPVTDAHDALS